MVQKNAAVAKRVFNLQGERTGAVLFFLSYVVWGLHYAHYNDISVSKLKWQCLDSTGMCVTEMHVLVIKTECSNIASCSDKNLFMQLCN